MSEIKLFQLSSGNATEIQGESGGIEKSLQTLIESNLDQMLAVRFVASEHSTGKLHKGRIDWTSPRLICVAADFTKHDEHAVRQINRNIDLIRYRRFGMELLALELLTSTTADAITLDEEPVKPKPTKQGGDKPVSQALAEIDQSLRDLWEELRAFVLGLGGDVVEKQLKLYVAFRRIKNFVTVTVQKKGLCLYLRLDPSTVTMEEDFTRDMTGKGHWGTGDLEVWVSSKTALKKAEPIIVWTYEEA